MGRAAKSRLGAKSVQRLSAGRCEGEGLGPTGGSVQGDRGVFCSALYHTDLNACFFT